MKKKYTLKVYPVGAGRQVYRVMEVPGEYSLDDLCEVILSSFDFTHEHLYEFCMDNKMYSDHSYQSFPENGEPSTSVKMDKLRLKLKQKFSLHYDFGDDWMFAITVQKIEETEKTVEPKIIKEKGKVKQYPDGGFFGNFYYDEDEDE